MKKILLIKLSSMGDLIQTLPAITEAAQAMPGLRFDWLVDEAFEEIPSIHPSINKIIPIPLRRWKKNKWQALRSGEMTAFVKLLRQQSYDMVIDMQSNLKSAILGLFAKGKRFGLDKRSVHEFGAQFTYHKTIFVNPQQNHVHRLRQILATFLNYTLPNTLINYGIINSCLPELNFYLPKRFVFITPIASVSNKLWPEPFWQVVINSLVQSGFEIVIPWWSQAEKERGLRLQNNHPKIHLLPQLDLKHKASVLTRASAAISLDTGLAHLAAALNIPNICLYGPGNFKSCGTIGYQQSHVVAKNPACSPCESQRCTYSSDAYSACMSNVHPQQVLDAFYALSLCKSPV